MLKNNFKFKNLIKILFILKITEIIFTANNINILKNLNILVFLNKIIEFPWIIITYLTLIYIYKKIYNVKNILYIICISCSILFISLLTKEIIKKYIFISRPYVNIKKKYDIKNIPKWIIYQWKKKTNSSFPSGHTLFTSYWIITFWKKKMKKINIIIIIILLILTLNRLIFLLHRSYELIFSFIINKIIIYNIQKIKIYINKNTKL